MIPYIREWFKFYKFHWRFPLLLNSFANDFCDMNMIVGYYLEKTVVVAAS